MRPKRTVEPSIPVVGEGATIRLFSDRYPYRILWVSPNGKRCKLLELDAEPDPTKNNEMGHQNWILKDSKFTKEIFFHRGVWREKVETASGKITLPRVLVYFGKAEYYYDWTM